MKAVVYSFTRRGAMLSINIGEALQKFDFEVRCLTMPKFAEEKIFLEAMDDHNKACEYAFKECQLIVFVGAVGIAVRTIAPYIKNKLVDPAVLSVDEGGNFARNNMIINSMKAAKDFAAALVDGQEVGLFTDYPIISALPRQIVLKDKGVTGLAITKNRNVNPFDLTVQLWPRNIYLGIGCRRGTTLESIETLVLPKLKELGIDLRTIVGVASVDLKKDEAGLLNFAAKYNWEISFFTAEELQNAAGEFSSSDFVKSVVGVSNVCERSAVLAANNGSIISSKCSLNGVTLAVAEADIVLDFEKLS